MVEEPEVVKGKVKIYVERRFVAKQGERLILEEV